MGQLFGSIYCWLEEFFGLELANYLWGMSSPHQTGNMFIGIGLSMIVISAVLAAVYYYVLNHPRLNNWWGWSVFLLINATTNFIVGWQWVLKDFYGNKMEKESAVTGKWVELNITQSDILAFGVTNMIDAVIAFIIISYIIKWRSSNCSRAPF